MLAIIVLKASLFMFIDKKKPCTFAFYIQKNYFGSIIDLNFLFFKKIFYRI